MKQKSITLTTIGIVLSFLSCRADAQQPVTPAGGVAPVIAPAVNYSMGRMIKMHPDQKRPLVVNSSERNPYAKRSPNQEIANEGGDNAEELEIRNSLNSLSVSGRSLGDNGFRLLLGGIILEQGRILPQLLPEQSESLKVMEVTKDSVVLAWLDIETGEPTGKTMQLPYDLSPIVNYVLPGQKVGGEDSATAELRMGILKIGQDRVQQESRMAARESTEDSSNQASKERQ